MTFLFPASESFASKKSEAERPESGYRRGPDAGAKESDQVPELQETEGDSEQIGGNGKRKDAPKIKLISRTVNLQTGGTDGQEKRQRHRKRVHNKTDGGETEKAR